VVLSGKSSRNSRSMTLKLKQMATRLENQLNKGE
jgi:cytochrome c biogenesis protein